MAEDGPDAEHSHSAVQRSANSTVVYCGSAERVCEGFLLALSAMQASSDLLAANIVMPAGNLIQENN